MMKTIIILISILLNIYFLKAAKGKLKSELLTSLNQYTNNDNEKLELLTGNSNVHDIEVIKDGKKKDIMKNQIVKKTFKPKYNEYNEKLIIKKSQITKYKNPVHRIRQRQLDASQGSELDEIKRWRHSFYKNFKNNPSMFRPQMKVERDEPHAVVSVVKDFGRDEHGRKIRLFGIESSGYKYNQSQSSQMYDYSSQNSNFPTLAPVISNRLYQEKYGNEFLSPMKSKQPDVENPIFQENVLSPYNYNTQRKQNEVSSHNFEDNGYNPVQSQYNGYNNIYFSTTSPPPAYTERSTNFFTTINPYISQQMSTYTTQSPQGVYYNVDSLPQSQQISGSNNVYGINCPPGTKVSSYNPRMCEQVLLNPIIELSTQPIGVPEVSEEDISGAKPDENVEKCNNPKMQEIIEETIITNDADKSKRAIQERLENEFNTYFNVICGTGFFSYIAHTDDFCQVSGGGLNCYVFSPVCQKIQTSHFYSYPNKKNKVKKGKYNVIHKGKVFLNRN
uniref:Ground-like domain-containing protein n=1 Tax=Parastrongyloides trichosuri TaxID=131310 RepID=A0A0N4Z4J5_PARTI